MPSVLEQEQQVQRAPHPGQGQDIRGWQVQLAEVRVKKEKNKGFFFFASPNGMKFREKAHVV